MFKKYEWVGQDDIKDCGVCSLLTIIRTYGGEVSKEYLRELTKTTKEGTTAFHLLEAGKKIGFSTKALKGDILNLDNELLPCIAHTVIDSKYQHFLVIMQINKKKKIITVSDPAKGIKKYNMEDYRKISTNQYLIFIPNKKIPVIKKNKEVLKNVLKLFIQYKSIFISLFIFSLLYTVLNILTAFNFQVIIESVLNYSSKDNLYFVMVIFLFLYILKSLIDLIRNNLLNFINHTFDYELISHVFLQIISLPYLYYKTRTTGEVIARINELGTVKEMLGKLFMSIFVDLVLVIFVFCTLYSINSKLTMIGIIMILLYFVVIKLFNFFFELYIKRNEEERAMVNSYMVESINNIDVIKSQNIESIISDQMNVKYNQYLNSSYKFQKLYNTENFIKDIINHIGLTVILFIATMYVLEGKMTLGEVITYNSILIYFLEPIKSIIEMSLYFKKTKISINRVDELYEVPKENMVVDQMYNGDKLLGDIKINSLNYSYYGRKNVFENVNFNITRGDKVLIYGKSGSGKSTIGKILMKFFPVERGKVFIDGRDINDYSTLDIRKEVCYIGQNEGLFSDSIYDNITLKRSVSFDEFLNACNISKVDELVVNNPMGYNMLLEESGSNLSGGERQRIILARALLKKSSIYILDEALNQLDIAKEREIITNLFNEFKDRTIIYISHRFNNKDLFNNRINMMKVTNA